MQARQFYEYKVWDLPLRLFHWINFSAIVLLFCFGMIMLFKTELGISATEAKINLKVVHVTIGYVFLANLAFRIIWAYCGC